MLNKKEKQNYTKEDIEYFDILSNFKKNYPLSEQNMVQNYNKIEEKYTLNDQNNFEYILKNQDDIVSDNFLKDNSHKHNNLDYTQSDLKNFERLDNKVYSPDTDNEYFKDKIKPKKIDQTNYQKKDLENFNEIIKNEDSYEKSSEKIINVYEGKYYKSKKENFNIKKIKILYFD